MDTGATLVLVWVGITTSGLLSEGTTDAPARGPQRPRGVREPVSVSLAPPPRGRLRRRTVEDDAQYTQTERRFKLLHVTNFRFATAEQKREWFRSSPE